MGTSADVVVVGGGVIGLTTAYFLAKAGATVRVLERQALGQEASWAGAGIIPPGNFPQAATPYDRLRAYSSQMYPAFSAELRDATGRDNGYRVCGGVELFHDDPTTLLTPWQQEQIPFTLLSPEQLREREPHVQARGPLAWLPGMAQVRNPRHVQALVAACAALGVDLHTDEPVTQLERHGDRVTAIHTTQGQYSCGQALLAAGAWGEDLLQMLGVQVGIHPVRGQIILFKCAEPPFRAVLCDDKNYLVARDDGHVLAGATEEPEAGFEKANTVEGTALLHAFACALVPLLTQAPVVKRWAGLRPGTRDGLPYLGRIPGTTNAFIAGGHYRAGVQLSPGTGRLMADVLLGQPPALDLHPFRLDRPDGPRLAPAFRS